MKTEIVKYTTNEAEIVKMADIYLKLTIDGIEDTEGFEAVHSAKMVVVKHRTSINKLRKTTNADAQTFIKTNNANAKKLLDLMEPIETHLKTEEAKITEEKERIRAEEERLEKIKIDGRVTALFAVGVNIPHFEAAMLSDAEYMVKLDVATNEYNTERLRLQEEQKAKEEAEAKLEADRAEIVRIKKEQEAKAKEQADKEAALEEQAKLIEDEKKAKAERKEREEFEKQAKEYARIQAEKDAKEKAEKAKEDRKREEEEHINEVKEARYKSLKRIGYIYSLDDLGTMPDKKYFKLFDKHQAILNTKQSKLLAEKLEKERIEAEKKRLEKEKADREAKEQETKEARFESLEKIGFKYPFNDLGIMPDRQYIELYDKHWTIWDKKRQALLAEKLEKERVEKEKAEADEKARAEALKPDKEKLIQYAKSLTQIIGPDVKDKAAHRIVVLAEKQLSAIAQEIIKKSKEL